MPSKTGRGKVLLGAALLVAVAALVALDQWTKAVAASALEGRGTLSLVGDFVVLVYINNRGAFLSLGSRLPDSIRNLLLIALPLVAIPFLVWALLGRGIGGRSEDGGDRGGGWAERSTAVLVAAGGLGNLIDRIFRGEVRDFINFGIGRLRTGIMNLADLYILFALIVIAATFASRSVRARRPEASSGPSAGAGDSASKPPEA